MQSVYKLVANTNDFDAKIRKSKQNLTQFASHGKLGMEGMTKAIGGSIAAFASWTTAIIGAAKVIGNLVKTNMEFEQATANLAAVMGTTRDNVTALTSQAKQLGATTQYTAIQISDLQTNLARLGFTQQEILNSTKSVSSLATATVADLGEAANLAGAALRGFGMDSSEMDRVCSAMAVSTTKSALSFEKLATAIPIVAPVAKQFGFTIEDTLTLLGKLSDAGMDASMAATATRNILLNLANSSGKLATKLGTPVHSIEELAPALQKLKEEGIDLAEMFRLTDKRSVAAFGTFIQNADTLVDFKKSITDVSDAMQGMVDEQLNTLQGSTIIMKSAWEGLMLTFSNSNSILKKVTDGLGNFLSKWTEFRKRTQGGDDAVATFQKGVTSQQKANLDAQIKAAKEAGHTNEELIKQSEDRKEKLNNEKEALQAEYNLWLKRKELIASGKSGLAQGEEFASLKGIENTIEVSNNYAQRLARINDQIAQRDYIIGVLSPQSAQTAEANADAVGNAEQKLSTRILAIKNQEAKDIAAIDREKFKTEEQYENEVYRIKRESLLKQRSLYAEGGDKYIQTDTAIANLDIQHQARLNRGFGKSKTVSVEEFVVPGSLKDLKNILAEAQECLEGCVVGSEAWAEALEEVKKAQEDVNAAQELITPKTKAAADNAQATTDAWQNATMALQSAGSAMNSIENPAAKVAGTVAQAVASVMLGFAQASIQGAALGPWGWIATTMSALATAVATVSTIKSVTAGSYAEGGIIPGSSYSGDRLTANVNSGELILNRAQQASIASQLQQGSSINNGTLSTRIKGGDILIALDNTNRSRGGSRGTYAYSK